MVGLMDLGISRGILLVTYDRTLNPSGAPNLPVKAGMQLTQWVSLAMFLLTLGGLSVMAYWGSISADVRTSMLLHALSGALTILTLPLRALLEIQGKFGALNIIRSLLACSVPLAPLLPGLGEGLALTAAAAYVLAVRLAGLWSYRRACGLGAMKLGQVPTPERSWQRAFVSRCGWVGLTNVGSLMLTYADRLVLGSIASVTEVANYVVAHELATKIWMVTGAILSAATPKVAADLLTQQTSGLIETPASIHQVKWFIVGAVVVPSVILAALLRPALDLWLLAGHCSRQQDPDCGHGAQFDVAVKLRITATTPRRITRRPTSIG